MQPVSPNVDYRRWAIFLAAAFAAAAALFYLLPATDIAFSRLFFDGTAFPIAAEPWARVVRDVVWRLSQVMAGLSLAGIVLALLGVRLLGLPWRRWAFVALLYLLGPGLLVNELLKAHWGRARPADILEFGGAHAYTPPLALADECARNCSFVSGEGSTAVAFAVAVVVLAAPLRKQLGKGWHGFLIGVAAVVAVAGNALRIMSGRHFLSDTVFGAILILAVAVLLHSLLLSPRRGTAETPAGRPS